MRLAWLASTGVAILAVFLGAAPPGAAGQEPLGRRAEPGGVDQLILIQASVAVDRSHPEQVTRPELDEILNQLLNGELNDKSAVYAVNERQNISPVQPQHHRALLLGVVIGTAIVLLFLCTLAVYRFAPDGEFDRHKAICNKSDFTLAAPCLVSSPGPKSPPSPGVNERANTVSEGVRGRKVPPNAQAFRSSSTSASAESTTIRSPTVEAEEAEAEIAEAENAEAEEVSHVSEESHIDVEAQRLRNRVEEHMRALTPPRRTSGTVKSPSPTPDVQACWETLPPICPSLILVDCEARCAIALNTLMSMAGKLVHLDVIGLSGNQLFRADVQPVGKGKAGLMLNVSLAHLGSIPRVSVLPLTGMGMQINGPGGSPYGWLKQGKDGFYEVIKDDKPRLVIAGNLADLTLEIRACSDKQIRATASPSLEYIDGQEHLEFRVQPGFDMVLIVSCVLAVMLLGPRNES